MNEAVGGQQPALSEAEGSAVGGPSGTPLLAVEGLHVAYGRVAAVRGISFSVPEGAIVSLIGANGAGKTTTLAAISGVVPVRSGRIRFRGEEITRLPPHAIVRRGIVQVPEGRQVLAYLSVEENLAMGAYQRRDRAGVREDIERMYARFPALRERRRLPAGSLSGGEQQMLAIARALMARPKMLLLDEPSMGLAPLLVNEIFRILAEIHAEGRTILLVEQNARKALAISDYAYVLETGRVTIAGPGADLANDERVVAAYLGRAIGKAG
jgi:branched-chain amino acid transport system ATP-binding protein